MSVPGRPGRTGADQMAQLDAAMNETFAEIAQQGSGVTPDDVSQPSERRRSRRPREESADDTSWLTREQQPQRRQRRAERRDDTEPDAAATVLDEAQDDVTTGRPQRDSQGRFLPQREDTDEDEDDVDSDEDEADGQRTSGGRRSAVDADETDDEDDDVESEGRQRTESDEEGRQRRSGRRRFPREVRREIDRQVRDQVGKVVEERDRLREAESQRTAAEGQALQFLVKAIGTQQQRDALQEKVNNTRLPVEQRNQAAALLNRYKSNEQYVRTYRTALLASIRHEQANLDQQVMQELAKFQIQLDPAIVAEGRRDKTLIHAVRQGILLERKRNEAEIAKQRRAAQTRRGSESEREVRNGQFGRTSMASSNGRRANGRVATVDRLRGAMGLDRGLGSASRMAAPTDETLRQLRDGEISLRDLGLAP